MTDAPDPKSAQIMATFDELPEPLRRFVADYPRGVPSLIVAQMLAMEGGDISRAIQAIRELAPVQGGR